MALFTDGFALYVGITQKCTVAALQPHFGTTLMKGNPHSGQNFGQFICSYILFGRKMTSCAIFTDTLAVTNGFDGWSGT